MGIDYKQIMASARIAQKKWAERPADVRTKWLKKFQKYLRLNQNRIVEAIQADTHKPTAEALGIEIMAVTMTADYYQKNTGKILKPRRAKTHWIFKNKKVLVERSPHGVVGILGPFNLPFSLTIGDAIPALMAGNAVIIKPSEWTPKSAILGANLALESGLPPHLLQVVEGGAEAGSQLIENVDCIFFTGSTAVGRKVAMKAAELLKPCILELGGKAPMIVLADADLDRAAHACVWGRFAHSGQHCIAIERVYVAKKIAESFINKVIDLTKQLTPQELSPLTLPTAPAHLKELIDDAVAKGAAIKWQTVHGELPTPVHGELPTPVHGELPTPVHGELVEPRTGTTILIGVDHTMRVMKEESFGPLLPIMVFDTPDEALRLANDSESGLSAVIFTQDKIGAEAMARKIEAGNVSINDVMDHFMIIDAPFGGWKNSGLGVRHAAEGLLQFTKPKTIFIHRFSLPFLRNREFWWFPYTKWIEKILKALT